MERLTIPDVRVDEHTTRRSVIDVLAVQKHAMEIYHQLKIYEDIAELCGGFDRLRELAEADKDGRCVVLPCKVGDTVWRIIRDGEPHITRDEVRDMYFADDMTPCVELVGGRVTFTEKFGKTVFLSREEAERALQEME
nr:MAG TPA: hypothetical protein [Caudoviricetes sp.]